MRDLSFEQLFILAVLLVAGLVNLVLDWLRARGRTAQPQDRGKDVAVEEEELDLAEVLWRERTGELPPELERGRVRVPPPELEPARVRVPPPRPMPPVVAPVSPPRPPIRPMQPRRLRHRIDPREARRGVVLMTILGPCRGVEAPAGNASGRHPQRERVE